MDLVFKPEAGELHTNQVGDGSDENPFPFTYRCGSGNRFEVLGPNFLADENSVDGAPGTRMLGIQEHIDARYVTMSETMRRQRRSDCVQVMTINSYINVLGQPGGHRVQGIDVQEHGEAAHNAVGNACALKRSGESLCDIEDLLHSTLEYSVGQHGVSFKF